MQVPMGCSCGWREEYMNAFDQELFFSPHAGSPIGKLPRRIPCVRVSCVVRCGGSSRD